VTLSSFFGRPLLGIFLLGMLTKRAKANAAFAGLLAGLGVAIWLGTATNVSFLSYGAFCAPATFVSGWLPSFFGGDPSSAVLIASPSQTRTVIIAWCTQHSAAG
jgi:Na+/proline symporter